MGSPMMLLYSFFLPDFLWPRVDDLLEEGHLPAASIMLHGVWVGLALCVVRVVLNETILRSVGMLCACALRVCVRPSVRLSVCLSI